MSYKGLLAASLVLMSATPAFAATVYNNGGPTITSGNETTAWVQAETFSFDAATVIGGAGVYLGGFGNVNAYDGAFQYFIFADGAGTPGSVLATGAVSPTITDSGTPWAGGGNAYLFQFSFADFAAAANTTYHFGIHASGAGDYNRDEIYWVTTDLNRTNTGIESFGGTFDNWTDNGNEHAFFLTDGVAGVVPEPTTWAMMIGGIGMVGGAMRRRRVSTKVSFA
ncbi:PEPxxWA-CTERM sorting domain-containing protein [Microvirga sp. SRT01]|jgi:hypothetical protein|uniref:PEPxxWA-CTERM sorting domain-containing protein n=1 Tax=Sphingomonas longa TaxID=2778730 RepID=A0ABS2D9W7_9SPHN|nr:MULTISPECIES: PEPxxWA-CTERM sorting domain-containing protein [Alphaproteobacteria]MBM6577734.1 PEPxxWA-CTERM sorting domain-containing protein [Sphingomonas sp. BT552]MBR7710776.1 PEPxxWA-CTERM sorting domain-containing protein [Microvirga sp. SRT01]